MAPDRSRTIRAEDHLQLRACSREARDKDEMVTAVLTLQPLTV